MFIFSVPFSFWFSVFFSVFFLAWSTGCTFSTFSVLLPFDYYFSNRCNSSFAGWLYCILYCLLKRVISKRSNRDVISGLWSHLSVWSPGGISLKKWSAFIRNLTPLFTAVSQNGAWSISLQLYQWERGQAFTPFYFNFNHLILFRELAFLPVIKISRLSVGGKGFRIPLFLFLWSLWIIHKHNSVRITFENHLPQWIPQILKLKAKRFYLWGIVNQLTWSVHLTIWSHN